MILSIELKMLLFSVILGIVHLFFTALLSTKERGMAWNMSPRDQPAKELTGVAGRVSRAFKNFKETFSFFAAAILIVQITTLANSTTALGAQLYFWARLVYIPIYALGIPFVRSVVWMVSIIGILMVISAVI
jgi:uncharacterized MAPEG superfamily protein